MRIDKKHIGSCVEIFNSFINSGEVIFKPLTNAKAEKLFFSQEYNSIGVYKEKDGELIGFAFGTVCEKTLYVSYIGVKTEHRRKGIGMELYLELEQEAFLENPLIEKIDCMFYNPCSLPWIIPNHLPHEHAGVPGVDMECDAYGFFKSLGFEDYADQRAYYMPLKNFELPHDVEEKKERLKKQGIEICYFNEDKHFGFSQLFDNLKNEGWRKGVMSNLDKKIVVAVKDGRIIGYTGPLIVSSEGRGTFCGVGVHTDFRSFGIGKVIFSTLCHGLKEMGAEYISLFTGETNPAKFMYESIGFELVRKFSCMRKMLNIKKV